MASERIQDPPRYLVVGTKPWNRRIFEERIACYPGQWRFCGSRDELSLEKLRAFDPRFIFFLHWSWNVPAEVIHSWECVCFHMTDVPYGRGGSPLQNLIVQGHRRTKLTALRMTEEVDGGPVYLKSDLSLEGNAEEIYIRATELAAEMIGRLISGPIRAVEQTGEVTVFSRRKPTESCIPELADLHALHDFIRMLDADGYPSAFLDHGGFRYRLRRSALYDGRIEADVTITPLAPEIT